ncbi:hypothetical protein [Chelatococcus asaccharovorans]|uniref:Tail-like repeat protein n=1 Tax=Chelatococcus asaccharovorans TaxID=28210 RepID=A0A2V3UB38_9HYPH|nr:hypothetical protein [Chelatococcus asaccharovorans]MBS7703324.1 hypothetical protein [Chelatococcus asaccharovorans]PXW61657.1 tail-like repeat protein [Chelatococcus asaccharovorans]
MVDLYRFADDTLLTTDFFNRLFGDIDGRLKGSEASRDNIETRTEAAISAFNQRVNAVLAEFVASITGIAQVGALSNISASGNVEIALGPRMVTVWPQYRGQVTIPAYAYLTAANDPSLSMGGPISGYDANTGELTVNAIVANGAGSALDWRIGISASNTFFPEQEISGSQIRFRRPDGSWGDWLEVGGGDISSISGLPAALASKANQADVVAALAEKATITALTEGLALKAAISHLHTIANITGLQAALDAKAAITHVHDMTNINGLADALAAKAAAAAVLALSGGTLTGLLNVKTQSVATVDLNNITGSVALNLSNANHFRGTVTGNTTFTITGAPVSGVAFPIILELTNPGSKTLTFPSGAKWPGGTQPAFTVSGVDIIVGISRDAGATIRWALSQKDSK